MRPKIHVAVRQVNYLRQEMVTGDWAFRFQFAAVGRVDAESMFCGQIALNPNLDNPGN
jgi:hypothetical protein